MYERTSFRKVAELLPDAVVLTDADGRITWTNRAFHDLCGYSRSFVRHRKPGSFLQGPDTDAETVGEIRAALREAKPVEAELLNYHQDGRPYWVSLRITPVKDASGALEGFIAIERETTRTRGHANRLEHEVGELYLTLTRVVEGQGTAQVSG